MKREERKYLFQFLEVFDQQTNEQLGFLGDLSEDGVMLITSNPPNLYTKIDICIIDGQEDLQNDPIQMQIETRWIKKNINPDQFCVGCQIIKKDSKDEKKFIKIGETLTFNDDMKINRVAS